MQGKGPHSKLNKYMSTTKSHDDIVSTAGRTEVKATNRNQQYAGLFNGVSLPKNDVTYITYDTGSLTGDHSPGSVGKKGTIITENTSPGTYNPVFHTKEEWDCPITKIEGVGKDFYDHPDVDIECTSHIGAAGAVEFGINSSPITTTVETMVAEATRKMDPSRVNPGDFNLPQFAGELREMRDLVDLASLKILRAIPRERLPTGPHVDTSIDKGYWYTKLTRQEAREFKRKPIGTIAEDLVKLDLARKFALEPFYADLLKILKLADGLFQTFSRLRNGKPFRVYGYADRADSTSFTADSTPYDYYHWGNEILFTKEVRTWAMVRYDNPLSFTEGPLYERFVNASNIAMDYLGFQKPISVAWELTPMSFVIDWFLDIGSWLEQFNSGTTYSQPFTVLESGYSVKDIAYSVGYVKHHAGASRAHFQSEQPFPKVKGTLAKTTYQRVLADLPWGSNQIEPPEFKVPDLNKIGTLLELSFLFSR